MILKPSLSHMPFTFSGGMLYCASDGPVTFTQPQSNFDSQHGIAPRSTKFQPWEMWIDRVGASLKISHNWPVNTPACRFCNPVSIDGINISFVYARYLYTGVLDGNNLTQLSVVAKHLFTGFHQNELTVIGKSPCATGHQIVVIDGDSRQAFNTGYDELLRVVPVGSRLLMTGRTGKRHYSVLSELDGTDAKLVTVNGSDVYKCHLSEDLQTVVHAVKETEHFESRRIDSGAAQLIALDEFRKD